MTINAPDRRQNVPRPKLRRGGMVGELLETAITIVLVYTLVNLATVRFFIDGPSMQPNFFAGQFLIVSRTHYLFGEPQRGDVVVFNAPGNRLEDPPLIKRLIGLPGETVEFRSGSVYINGTLLDEPYLREPCAQTRCADGVVTLGADEFFLMGDNRNNSRDSRVFGAVGRERIIGQAVFRYWPPGEWGLIFAHRYPA
jgi:signal peptidase I